LGPHISCFECDCSFSSIVVKVHFGVRAFFAISSDFNAGAEFIRQKENHLKERAFRDQGFEVHLKRSENLQSLSPASGVVQYGSGSAEQMDSRPVKKISCEIKFVIFSKKFQKILNLTLEVV